MHSRALAKVEARLRRHGAPRRDMTLMVMLTGATGLFTSWVMLHAGATSMPWRYGVATAVAYAVFLALFRWWIARSQRRLRINQGQICPEANRYPGI